MGRLIDPSRNGARCVHVDSGRDAFSSKPPRHPGAVLFSIQPLARDIIESAGDHGADLIATPCPVCQMNVEDDQGQINKNSGLDGQVIKAPQLEKFTKQERRLHTHSPQGSSANRSKPIA